MSEGKKGKSWPAWWQWELEITPHLEKRMVQRDFGEIDLRGMLDQARGYHADVAAGRFVIETRHRGNRWEVIVEPDAEQQLLVVVTAYGKG